MDTAEDFEEFVFRKTWRAPRLIWMKPSGNCPYDPSTAWAREDGPTTERLVEGLSGRFIQLLGIDLDKIAGDAHLRLAKEGRPPQAPKRTATEKVTQEVPVPQPSSAKEWEATHTCFGCRGPSSGGQYGVRTLGGGPSGQRLRGKRRVSNARTCVWVRCSPFEVSFRSKARYPDPTSPESPCNRSRNLPRPGRRWIAGAAAKLESQIH